MKSIIFSLSAVTIGLILMLLTAGCKKQPPREIIFEKPVVTTPDKTPEAKSAPTSARDYFDELKAANTFNKYKDKYVCFRDDEDPAFAVVSTVEDMTDAMARSGDVKTVDTLKPLGQGLYVQTYFKGVSSGEEIYEKIRAGTYSLDLNPTVKNGRAIYSINWKTGRYRYQLFVLSHSKTLPVMESSGKCELIHAGDKPSIAESE